MTQRLVGAVSSTEEWPRFDGWLASQGIDPLELPTDRLLNLIYHYLVRDGDRGSKEGQAALRKFEAQLWRPPVGQVGEGVWSAEAETAAFRSLKARLQPDKPEASQASPTTVGATPPSGAQRRAQPRQRRTR